MTRARHAVQDALERPTGAVPNGDTMRARGPRRRTSGGTVLALVVVVTRPAVRSWTCDACGARGSGWPVMARHAERRGHRSFTAR